jgi:hypothetical protein
LSTADLAGRLLLLPGQQPAIACARPMVGPAMMDRLTAGRRAGLLPDLVAAVFTVCAVAQRATARRVVRAALGLADTAEDAARERQALALHTAREHLQRLALDLPALLPQPGIAADPGWVRDAPVMALPGPGAGPAAAGSAAGPAGQAALHAAAAALPGWLEKRLLGQSPASWLQAWEEDPDGWLDAWARSHDHPATRWLRGVRGPARALALPCRPLDLGEPAAAQAGAEPGADPGAPPGAPAPAGLRDLAAALAADPRFPEHPLWRGAPAETGPWTRAGLPPRAGGAALATAWLRLGARIAELARIACGRLPDCGALAVAPGEGIAYTEMSRGLLVHWLRLAPQAQAPDTARAACCRVLAPTEWNFHPDGSFGRALAEGRLDADAARLGALALDPCVGFEVVAAPAAAGVRDA